MSNLTKFQLPNGEYVSCVLWNGLYHITGTDIGESHDFYKTFSSHHSSHPITIIRSDADASIPLIPVRALSFRFEAFGRPVKATKKWEEGVFSDLRNLKPGQDACLEEPK